MSLDVERVMLFVSAFYENGDWRITVWMDEILDRYWQELDSTHDKTREYIADALSHFGVVMVNSVPSPPCEQRLIIYMKSGSQGHLFLGQRYLFVNAESDLNSTSWA